MFFHKKNNQKKVENLLQMRIILTTINPQWLEGLENLEYLSFAENKLTTIDINLMVKFQVKCTKEVNK
ncbi:MAG: leucine-rich repeat domain-containing protein [Candidatus Peribacteria bacterium]|jgi:Leucine-rich repeat (LRR) protein|nr:leucine-rich repeat domain-containing protein [Candidatus Peribacteria bacterium]